MALTAAQSGITGAPALGRVVQMADYKKKDMPSPSVLKRILKVLRRKKSTTRYY